MNLSTIKALAERHTQADLEKAAALYEKSRENPLGSTGKDEGEILTHLLMAAVVRQKVEQQGLSLADALKEHSQTVSRIVARGRKTT